MLTQEYIDAVEDFPLAMPAGATFPPQPDPPIESMGQVGVGAAQAYFTWECAWEYEVVRSFDEEDEQLRSDALDALRKLPDTAFYRDHVEDTEGGYERDILTPAELGDAAPMREYVENNCRARDAYFSHGQSEG